MLSGGGAKIVPETFYRWVKSDLATEEDFRPQGAMGRRMRFPSTDPEVIRAWNEGLSVWISREAATEKAKAIKFLAGSYVVAITLEDGHEFEVVGPTGKDRDHYTIYGDARKLLALASEPRKMTGAP